MPPRGRGREGRPYRRARERVKRTSNICWICGDLIDPDVAWPDPWSFSVDHVEPVSRLEANDPKLLDPTNLRPAHLGCNSRRGNGTNAHALPKVRHSRNWLA